MPWVCVLEQPEKGGARHLDGIDLASDLFRCRGAALEVKEKYNRVYK